MGDQDSGCWYRFRDFQIVRRKQQPYRIACGIPVPPKEVPR